MDPGAAWSWERLPGRSSFPFVATILSPPSPHPGMAHYRHQLLGYWGGFASHNRSHSGRRGECRLWNKVGGDTFLLHLYSLLLVAEIQYIRTGQYCRNSCETSRVACNAWHTFEPRAQRGSGSSSGPSPSSALGSSSSFLL